MRAGRALFLACLPLVGGCAEGDFGRPRYPWLAGPAPSAVAAQALAPGPPSAFPLTDEEKELRKLADNLLISPHEHSRWFVTAPGGHGGVVPPAVAFERSAYAANLIDGHFRSATSRYARLIDDIRNDRERMAPFFSAARRVADLDRKREQSLAHVAALSGAELAATQARVRENIAVMTAVHAALAERCAAYRFALERLVIALPSPMAVEAERHWTELSARVAEVQVVAAAPVGPARPGG
jgi:hypothetical protein